MGRGLFPSPRVQGPSLFGAVDTNLHSHRDHHCRGVLQMCCSGVPRRAGKGGNVTAYLKERLETRRHRSSRAFSSDGKMPAAHHATPTLTLRHAIQHHAVRQARYSHFCPWISWGLHAVLLLCCRRAGRPSTVTPRHRARALLRFAPRHCVWWGATVSIMRGCWVCTVVILCFVTSSSTKSGTRQHKIKLNPPRECGNALGRHRTHPTSSACLPRRRKTGHPSGSILKS